MIHLLKTFLNSPTGPKTIHFWAPTMKWALVLAGINDFNRPVERLSGTQNLSLLATGVVWTRWSFVIKPKNYLLASVNFFLASTALVQCSRIINYRLLRGDNWAESFHYLITSKNNEVKTVKEVDVVPQVDLKH